MASGSDLCHVLMPERLVAVGHELHDAVDLAEARDTLNEVHGAFAVADRCVHLQSVRMPMRSRAQ